MKTVIRIEHSDGWGMFMDRDTNDNTVDFILPELYERHMTFHSPYTDEFKMQEIEFDEKWFCAYKSIKQLQQWIMKDEFAVLFEYGYKVLLLDVTNYQEGNDQIIYTKGSIINSKDISNLFK
jgi:hypothetical protein